MTSLAWFRVFLTIALNWSSLFLEDDNSFCIDRLQPITNIALWISFIEVFNCLVGFTRSPLPAVLLFSLTRMGVEKLVAPMIPCGCWQHILTVMCWSLGDTIRFGSFAINTANPSFVFVKSIRFIVGPILFPIGAGGECLMVVLAAKLNDRPKLYVAAALWPIFFYPMMQQLLKQRRKHFENKDRKKQIKAV